MADWFFKTDARRRSWLGAFLVAGLGVALLWTRPGARLDRFSYDAQFLLSTRPAPTNLVLVKMDEEATRQLNQRRGAWDVALHAGLIDNLRRGGSKLVVFDVFLTEPGHPTTNGLFAQAIAAHGRVVLAGYLDEIKEPGFIGSQPVPPREPFLTAAAAWGLVDLDPDPADHVVRALFPGTDLDAGLAWAAASALKAPVTAQDRKAFFRRARWLRYYGQDGSLTDLNYFTALQKPPEYFRDKIVFIGGGPRVLFNHERETDRFASPFWSGPDLSGMDIHATAFLNLLNGDWLTRLPRSVESALLVAAGLLLVFIFGTTPSRLVIPAALAGAFGVTVAALLLSLNGGWWFGWVTVAAVQIPVACAWTLGTRRTIPGARPQAIQISGHTLLRTIGRGAYGEVWIARDVAGRFHAVKVIHRRRFSSQIPFEREFRGLQKFTPISRSHPGFVHILHLDREEEAGYFYYVMEAGDDELTGQTIDPGTYSARTLSRELTRCGRLPVEACLELGAALASALEHLHSHQLIHRDIKPSNIIFVNNVPKLADIGLVTDIGRDGQDVSYIGTEGYLAPEGPGTPAADVYSLGKVIYEAAMGFSQEKFPELPTTLVENPVTFQPLLELNEIIIRACAPDLDERYRTAAELRADLVHLRDRLMATKT